MKVTSAGRFTILLLVATVALVAEPRLLIAQHGHYGGGGGGLGGAMPWINLGVRALGSARSNNNYSNNHSNSSGFGGRRSYSNSYDNSHSQPNYTPRYTPQYTTPQYTQPQYTQPQYTTPQYTQPQTTQRQPVPVAALATNPLPPVKIKPKSNAAFLLQAKRMTGDQIRRNEASIDARLNKSFAALELELKAVEDAAKDAIVALLGAANPANAAAALVDALKRGDVDSIKILTAGQDAAFIRQLISVADARRTLAELRALALNGTFTNADQRRLIDALVAAGPDLGQAAVLGRIQVVIAGILIDAQIRDLLRTAVAGDPNQLAPLTGGGAGPIVIVPQMPRGQVIDLGNGGTFVGGGPDSLLTVSTGSVSESMGLDVAPGEPVPEAKSPGITSGIVLTNAPDSPEAVNYQVDNRPYKCEPSFVQPIEGTKPRVVAFDRGGSFGKASYTLKEGTYTFTLTPDKGWELFRQSISVTIDNSENVVDFMFVMANKDEVIPAGETKTLTGIFWIDIEFDDATGSLHHKKLESGTYKVALAADERSIDLFKPGAAGVFASSDGSGTGNANDGVLFAP